MRNRIVEEALTWKGTPYHAGVRSKGHGADCGLFIAQVMENVGALPHIDPGFYTAEHALHSSKEIFKTIVEQHAIQIHEEPLPGDIILYKFGLCRSHAALVLNYPKIIHAYIGKGVILDTDKSSRLQVEKDFFRLKVLM